MLSQQEIAAVLSKAPEEELENVRAVLSAHKQRHGYHLWQSTITTALAAFENGRYDDKSIALLLRGKDLHQVLKGTWYIG